jgi:hypothetical protein
VPAAADILRLRALCDELVQRAEADPATAGALTGEVAKLLDGLPKSPNETSKPMRKRRTGLRDVPVLDPFEVYRDNPEALAGQLAVLDLERLRDIVRHGPAAVGDEVEDRRSCRRAHRQYGADAQPQGRRLSGT